MVIELKGETTGSTVDFSNEEYMNFAGTANSMPEFLNKVMELAKSTIAGYHVNLIVGRANKGGVVTNGKAILMSLPVNTAVDADGVITVSAPERIQLFFSKSIQKGAAERPYAEMKAEMKQLIETNPENKAIFNKYSSTGNWTNISKDKLAEALAAIANKKSSSIKPVETVSNTPASVPAKQIIFFGIQIWPIK